MVAKDAKDALLRNGSIPEDEIWLKMGGDKGSGLSKITDPSFAIHDIESSKKYWSCYVY